MPVRADGLPRSIEDALDRRDEAMWRTRRLMTLVAGGAVTGAVVLGVVFAQELPGHSGSATSAGGGSAPSGSGATAPQPAASTPSQSSGGASQAQQQAPPSPSPAPPQVVSGGS